MPVSRPVRCLFAPATDAFATIAFATTALLATFLCAQGSDTGAPTVVTPLAAAIPALADHSAWAQDARYEGDQPDKSKRGVYPVGNGKVFGYLGLGARANTMQGVSGPTYQTAEEFAPKGHFGEHTLELLVDGKVVDLPEQHVRRVRGANFVVTVDEDPKGLSLRTLTFAPPDGTSIVRVIEVVDSDDQRKGRITLRLRGDQLPPRRDSSFFPGVDYMVSSRRYQAVFCLAGDEVPPSTAESSFEVEVKDAGRGSSWQSVLRIETYHREAQSAIFLPSPRPPRDAVESIRADAGTTLRWWQEKLKDTTYLDTDHKKIRDLFNDWKVIMLVQRDARSGAVSPMVNYRGCWVRDSVGPLLAFLRFNMWQEAKDILVYLNNATRLQNRVPNQVPLDLDFSSLPGKQIDWDKVEVPASEVPSWIVLMHFWYWRVTRDHDLIRAHKPLLDRCLRGQRRVDDALLPFHGDETWLHGALYSLWPERVPEGRFIADDQWQGRSTFSFAAGVQYLLCIQAIGEMENGLDEAANPEKYTGDAAKDPASKPGQRYLTRSFAFMQALEKAYWVDDLAMFAPALSPVNRLPHRQPYADANLMPLWLGWTFPSGERSRDNLKTTLARNWLREARIGETPTTGYACGHTQGKLVVALTERDAKNRLDAVDALLQMAEPAGEWGELYDDKGRPVAAYDAQWPNRCRPWESGVNLDALLVALCGIRFITVPNFDARDIRAKLRLPHGATYMTLRNVRKDGRDLSLNWRETFEKMSEQERKDNADKTPDKRRDPEQTHRRLRFRVDLNSPNPKQGYYDLALNAACTLFVRYLTQQTPIEEVEYWADDSLEFLPTKPAVVDPPRYDIRVPPTARTLYLSNRGLAAELAGGDASVCLVDTGLPMTSENLASALIDQYGGKVVNTLFIDWRAQAPGRATFKTAAFWAEPAWHDALTAFAAAGGKIVRAQFVATLDVEEIGKLTADADGRLTLPLGERKETVATAKVTSEVAREAVLRIGSSGPVRVELNGRPVLSIEDSRHPLPDLDSVLIKLEPGTNTLQFLFQGGGTQTLYVRVTDARGLPVDGVR